MARSRHAMRVLVAVLSLRILLIVLALSALVLATVMFHDAHAPPEHGVAGHRSGGLPRLDDLATDDVAAIRPNPDDPRGPGQARSKS